MKALLFSPDGRISRGPFWLGTLIGAGVVFGALIVAVALAAVPQALAGGKSTAAILVCGILAVVIVLAAIGLVVWVGLCLGIKRYHDHGKPGAWVLIQFAPLIGPFWYFIEAGCLAGTQGPNLYGPDPLRPELGSAPAGSIAPPVTTPMTTPMTPPVAHAGRPRFVLPLLLVLALPGVAMVVAAVVMASNTSNWLKTATRVEGTVVALKPGGKGEDGHDTFYAVVEARALDGNPFRITDRWATYPPAEIGSTTPLVYPEGRPNEAIIAGFLNLWLIAALLAGFGAAGTLFWLLAAALVTLLWKRNSSTGTHAG